MGSAVRAGGPPVSPEQGVSSEGVRRVSGRGATQ